MLTFRNLEVWCWSCEDPFLMWRSCFWVDTAGPTLRGVARCRTLQEGLRWPLSISGRSGDGLWVWLTTCAHGLADPLGRFSDTMRWVRKIIAGRFGLGCRRGNRSGRHRHRVGRLRSGRFCDTMRWLTSGVQATLCMCVRLATFADKLFKVSGDPGIVTSAYDSRLRTALSPNA